MAAVHKVGQQTILPQDSSEWLHNPEDLALLVAAFQKQKREAAATIEERRGYDGLCSIEEGVADPAGGERMDVVPRLWHWFRPNLQAKAAATSKDHWFH